MADIKVERKSHMGWLWAALAALLAIALIAWFTWPWGTAEQERTIAEQPGMETPVAGENQGVYDPDQQANMVVPYEGRQWIPADVNQAVRFQDEEMVLVGSVQGVNVYAHPQEGAGGGGGDAQIPGRLETQPYGRIYLRMGPDRYLPMVWESEVPREAAPGLGE